MRPFARFEDCLIFFQKISWRKSFAFIFLAIQVALIVLARFGEDRYFCWAPHDMQTEYELAVNVNGRELDGREISRRFRLGKTGRDPRAAGNVKAVVIQHCRTYGRNDEVLVAMDYTINGRRMEPWKWRHIPQKK
ncbi:MAG: hypothetical protein Q8Q08_11745 [Candidatus Omnitrophota bacterium]|nr:hypothetical protein [Candidatus Omnitrophota bacterium]MDZ4243181.1 hypothetical protein [Candidatus Omnitrophota bacterium]